MLNHNFFIFIDREYGHRLLPSGGPLLVYDDLTFF